MRRMELEAKEAIAAYLAGASSLKELQERLLALTWDREASEIAEHAELLIAEAIRGDRSRQELMNALHVLLGERGRLPHPAGVVP
jgi:hypothetical protein